MSNNKKAPAGTAIPNAGTGHNSQDNCNTFSDGLQVAYYKPGEPMRIEQIRNDLKELQGLVGGKIETVYIAEELTIICNEEGRLKGLEPNRQGIVGPFIVVGVDGDCFRSLKDAEIDVLREVLR